MSYAGPSAPKPSKASKARTAPSRPPLSVSDDGPPTAVFAAGLALGIAIGAGVALLIAPRSGATTRRRLARRGRRLARRGRDVWSDLREELHEAAARRRRAKQIDRPGKAVD